MSQEQQNNGMSGNGCVVLLAGIIIGILLIFSNHYIWGAIILGITAAISQTVSNSDKKKEREEERRELHRKREIENEKRKEKEESEKEERIKDYGKISYEYQSKCPYSKVEVYEAAQVVYLKYGEETWIFNFSDIIKVDIYEDGRISSSTTSTSGTSKAKTSSMLGRAAVGGVLLGGAGAVIGGATGKRELGETSTTKTQEVVIYSMVITINNLSMPTIQIKAKYEEAKEFIKRVSSILSIIIERQNKDDSNDTKIQISHEENEYSEVNIDILKLLSDTHGEGRVNGLPKALELYKEKVNKDGSNFTEYLEELVISDDEILSDNEKNILLADISFVKRMNK